MRITLFVLLSTILLSGVTFAEKPAKPNKKDVDVKKLLERMKTLEKRLERLEDAQSKQPRSYPPKPELAPGSVPSPTPKRFIIPPRNRVPEIPKSWTPYYFNDGWYYVIPLDEAPRTSPTHEVR